MMGQNRIDDNPKRGSMMDTYSRNNNDSKLSSNIISPTYAVGRENNFKSIFSP